MRDGGGAGDTGGEDRQDNATHPGSPNLLLRHDQQEETRVIQLNFQELQVPVVCSVLHLIRKSP